MRATGASIVFQGHFFSQFEQGIMAIEITISNTFFWEVNISSQV